MVQDVAPLVSPTYQIQSHAEFLSRTTASGIPTDLPAALDQLSHAAFGQYNGAIVGTPAFKRWFTSRPGMTDASRFVATIEGQVVSSLFVTVTPMQWNGEIVTAGLIDSVMTHPDHRRQGLATALLTRAVDFLSDQGGDLALLYTVAYSVPYRLYVSLGFADYLRVHLLQRPSGEGGTHPFDAARHKPAELRNFLDRAFSRHDGYLPMNDALWCWRREQRPASAPVAMHTVRSSGGIRGVFALGQAPIRTDGKPAPKTLLNDYAALEDPFNAGMCAEMLSASPKGIPTVAACADTNREDLAVLTGSGFASLAEESCMIKPLTRRAESALLRKPELWYAVTETIVGI